MLEKISPQCNVVSEAVRQWGTIVQHPGYWQHWHGRRWTGWGLFCPLLSGGKSSNNQINVLSLQWQQPSQQEIFSSHKIFENQPFDLISLVGSYLLPWWCGLSAINTATAVKYLNGLLTKEAYIMYFPLSCAKYLLLISELATELPHQSLIFKSHLKYLNNVRR